MMMHCRSLNPVRLALGWHMLRPSGHCWLGFPPFTLVVLIYCQHRKAPTSGRQVAWAKIVTLWADRAFPGRG